MLYAKITWLDSGTYSNQPGCFTFNLKLTMNKKKWKATFKGEKTIEDKIKEIANAIIRSDCLKDGYGLLGGSQGVVIFLYNYFQYSKEEIYKEFADKLVLDILKIAKRESAFSLCNGHLGILWGLVYLNKIGFIDCDVNEVFDNRLIHISDEIEPAFDRYGYDFLHGGLGYLFFLQEIEHKNKQVLDNINKGVNWLEKHSIAEKKGKGLSWISNFKSLKGTNLGLSHGMSSIIRVLTLLYAQNPDKKIGDLLRKAVQFIIASKQDHKYGSYFPNAIENNNHNSKSRLAWCYGDLGICIAIWHAGLALKDEGLRSFAIEVLDFSATRSDPRKEGVIDSGICHGAAGIAHIYNRFYQITNNELYRETALYWTNIALNQAVHKDGIAGFKSFDGSVWQKSLGLLTGVSGIGLVLLSSISSIAPRWDRCLLIS